MPVVDDGVVEGVITRADSCAGSARACWATDAYSADLSTAPVSAGALAGAELRNARR